MSTQEVKLTQKQVGFYQHINWSARMSNNQRNRQSTYVCFMFPAFVEVWEQAARLNCANTRAQGQAQSVYTVLSGMVSAVAPEFHKTRLVEWIAKRVRARLIAIIISPAYIHLSPKMVREIMIQELEAEINKGETSND